MEKALEYILSKFPDHRLRILELHENNDDFRTISEDYLTSAKALEEYRLNITRNREFEKEYLQVYLDLEKEIDVMLKRLR